MGRLGFGMRGVSRVLAWVELGQSGSSRGVWAMLNYFNSGTLCLMHPLFRSEFQAGSFDRCELVVSGISPLSPSLQTDSHSDLPSDNALETNFLIAADSL